MKPLKNTKKFSFLFLTALLLLIPTIYLISKSFFVEDFSTEKPSELIVTNISTTEAQIYWKTNTETIQKISYKNAHESGLYKESPISAMPEDILSKKNIYYTTITDLHPNSKYVFRIEADTEFWEEEEYTFKTKDISEKVELPKIITGQKKESSLILIDLQGEKYILDTQYHGTWVLDSKDKEYSSSIYANYTTKEELQSRLLDLLISPVHAQNAANCKTGITVNSPGSPSKGKVTDILNRWTASCLKGTYANECYEDVYCRSLKYGIDPAFAFAIWSNESGGSNYAYRSSVGDFGIRNIPSTAPMSNFDKQIEFFLTKLAKPSYIDSCTWDDSFQEGSLSKEMIMWGSKFYIGKCSEEKHFEEGKRYIEKISQIYKWYTNQSLSWPFTTNPQPNACSYASASTNTTYNSCSGEQTPTLPSPTPPSPTPPSPTPSPSNRKWLAVTGTGDDGQSISPEVDLECKDLGWNKYCTCIWKYNIKPGEYTKDAQIGQSCTVDGRVVNSGSNPDPKPKPESAICCLFNETLEYVEEKECSGTVLKDISERNCKTEADRVNILKGVNFFEVPLIVNNSKVQIATAKDLIEHSQKGILAVGLFRNDQWEKIVKNEEGEIKGVDFDLEPSEIYMVIATQDIEIPIETVKTSKEIEISKLVGWNLIPTSQFKNSSSTSTKILLDTQYSFIKQIAIWNSQQNIFDYTLRDNSGYVYGDPIPLSQQKGLFIKILP